MKTGKVSERILNRSVFRQIKTKRKEVIHGTVLGGDCAIFSFSEDTEGRINRVPFCEEGYALASCMQEAPVAAQEEASGEAVGTLLLKCANNLATSGAVPFAAMITLLLPESTEEAQLKQIMCEAEKTCAGLDIELAGGQTKVTKAVNTPYAVVTGYGKVKKAGLHTVKAAAPGQDIVISKWIGLEGTALLAKTYKEKLLKRYPSYLVEEAAGFSRYLSIIPEAATAVKSGVCAMHDASEGGIFGALWELAEGAGVGLSIDLKKLPLRQETVEVCEYLDVNPYQLMSGGCLIMTTRDGLGLVKALEKAGIPAVVVGKLTDCNDRILYNEDEIRYMDRPKTDEIYEILERNGGK